MSEMISKALDWIEEHCKPSFFGGSDLTDVPQWSDKNLSLIERPRAFTLEVHTLTGLIDYVQSNLDGLEKQRLMAVVKSPMAVDLISPLSMADRNRETYIRAICESQDANLYGRFMGLEEFIIWLQAGFVQDEVIKELLKIDGNIKDEMVTQINDDGVSQQVTARAGIARVENVRVPNPVILRPYRTFREIEQPASSFIHRMRSGAAKGEGPTCMLKKADGDAWQLEAIKLIKAYLKENLPDFVIIA